jgi:hypothetical protein
MPENEFEKTVSSELSGLKLKPSGEVWLKVEERIRKKKNRRVFAIIFLLAGLALLGYWQRNLFFGGTKNEIVNAEKQVDNKNNVEADKTKETGATNKNELEINVENNKNNKQADDLSTTNETPVKLEETNNKDQSNKINNEKLKTETTSRTKNSHDEKKPKPADVNLTNIKTPVTKSKESGETKKLRNQRIPPVKTTTEVISPNPDQTKQKEIVLNDTDASLLNDKEKTSLKDSTYVKEIKQDDIKDMVKNVETKLADTKIDSVKNDTATKKPETKKQDSLLETAPAVDSPVVSIPKKMVNKKWQLGMEFNPGISALSNEIFSFNSSKSLADLNSQGPPTGVGVPLSIADPSPRKAGFAFQLGGFARKQFTQRSGVSLGLRYAYYSDNIKIGATRLNISSGLSQFFDANSIRQAYGAYGDTINYTNRYHFIEIPVYYNLRLNKKIDHPLTLQLGLKYGRLISSNTLVYDSIATGIYYKSDKYLNKSQFGFSSSLNWTIANKQKFQWTIGPVFDLHFNSLLDSPFEKKKYLFFAGIRSAIIFNSKK